MKVWLTRELAEHIRGVLDPLIEQYSALARAVGGHPDDQAAKAHYVARAQGLIDAVNALAPPTGVPTREVGHVTADAVRRMRTNRGGTAKHRAKP